MMRFISYLRRDSIMQYLIFVIIFLASPWGIHSQSITLYKEVGPKETEKLEISVLNCTNIEENFIQEISCGNFTTECAQFYDKKNCDGNSAEINRESVKNISWRLDHIKSIGPCVPHFECDEITLESDEESKNKTFTVSSVKTFSAHHKTKDIIELYEHKNFKGVHAIVKVHDGCIKFPRKIKNRLSSVRFSSDVCLELHKSSDCSGKSVRFRRKRKSQIETVSINLENWGFDEIASSASLCDCPRINYTSPNIHSSCEHVTLYDEKDFKGNSKTLTVSKCVDLNDEWEGAAESMRLYKDCIIIYSHFGCQEQSMHSSGTSFTLIRKSNETQSNFTDLEEQKFDGQIRSIGSCYVATKSPMKAIYMALLMFITGISIAGLVNWISGREKVENKE